MPLGGALKLKGMETSGSVVCVEGVYPSTRIIVPITVEADRHAFILVYLARLGLIYTLTWIVSDVRVNVVFSKDVKVQEL